MIRKETEKHITKRRIWKNIEQKRNDKNKIAKIKISLPNFGFMKINTKEKVVDIQLREGFFNENKILSKIQIEF